jgi:hypothetical protein
MIETLVKKHELVHFCKLANLKCSGTKDELYHIVDEYLNRYKYTPRYIENLKGVKLFEKKFFIKYNYLMEKETGVKNYKPLASDQNVKTKPSTYTEMWEAKYPNAHSLAEKSQVSGVPLDILQQVYDRGLAAWRGGSHRVGASQHAWAHARVNSFLVCGKTFYFPDHLLAIEAMKKSVKAKNFWKRQLCKI